ncbi:MULTISPECIES: hypothetical protein [Sphingobacterium]|uniref:Glycosyltransferase 2-like domain-containing protein n=1 Tax=Sphingobacterium siyangense TaxID=459529 RepID=A0A562MJ23_9SPHI|nr:MULTISPECIES: hypothetical protein [Sphingobacterium]TWI19935.1 hypothetical protein IQ31_02375 [Sphingobacterium siyangense]
MGKEEMKILLIGYNRLDQIKVVLDAIKDLPNTDKFVFIDGARNENDSLVQEKMVDYFLSCGIAENQIVRPERNLGINHSIPHAIKAVFNNTVAENILILEDDCVPSLESINLIKDPLLQQCLDKGIISLTNYFDFISNTKNASYIINIKIPTIWGWVVTKKVWDRIDIFSTYKTLPNIGEILRGTNIILNLFFLIKLLITRRYHTKLDKNWGTWDNYLGLSCRKNKIDCFVLPINGVSNIGYVGTNTNDSLSSRNFDRKRSLLKSCHKNLVVSSGMRSAAYSTLLSIVQFLSPTIKLSIFYIITIFNFKKVEDKNYL